MTLWFLQQAAPEAPVEVQSSDSSDTASTSDTASVNSKDSEDSEDSDDDDETEESVSKNMPRTHLAIYSFFHGSNQDCCQSFLHWGWLHCMSRSIYTVCLY